MLTVDPSFQYTLANGGTQQLNLSESDRTLRGTFTTGGVDLNGDGDTLDTVRVMTPSNTNTHRYGLNTSLIWDLDDNHRLRAAYALDFGRHRQTGLYGRVNFSNPSAVNRSLMTSATSMSLALVVVPMVSKSHCQNSR